mgnify:CR=1 FL=1|jgi:hypothetical protein
MSSWPQCRYQALRTGLSRRLSSGQSWFPLLRGPKISVLWVRMLVDPGGATISGIESLPVAVDVQIRKVSEYLGITDTGGLRLETARPIIQSAWSDLQAEAVGPPSLAGTAAALDPAIWFSGSGGVRAVNREVSACRSAVSAGAVGSPSPPADPNNGADVRRCA